MILSEAGLRSKNNLCIRLDLCYPQHLAEALPQRASANTLPNAGTDLLQKKSAAFLLVHKFWLTPAARQFKIAKSVRGQQMVLLHRLYVCAVLTFAGMFAVPLPAQESRPRVYLLALKNEPPAGFEALVAAAGGTLHRQLAEIGMATAISNNPNFAADLIATGLLGGVAEDKPVLWSSGEGRVPAVRASGAFGGLALPSSVPANDPAASVFFPCQWNLTQIHAPGAWNSGQFGEGAKVAILDTGIDPLHFDLAGRVDFASGANFITLPSSCEALDRGSIPVFGSPFDAVLDLNGHGTFVAGTITTNNIGVTGVAPLAHVVPVKVLTCDFQGLITDTIAGILYAAALPDVQVINASFGLTVPRHVLGTTGVAPLVLGALGSAVNFAQRHGKLVVAAAGNGTNNDLIPVNMDRDQDTVDVPAQSGGAVGVYATNIKDGLASYSNHGISGTLVGAPGGDFPAPGDPAPPGCVLNLLGAQSFLVGPCSIAGLLLNPSGTDCNLLPFGAPYRVSLGTSLATATVSGVAALIQGEQGSKLTPAQVKTTLEQTADDLGKIGTDNLFSHGRVNAAAAVQQ